MENVIRWAIQNVYVLLAIIAAVSALALWLAGEGFSFRVSEVIQAMLQ